MRTLPALLLLALLSTAPLAFAQEESAPSKDETSPDEPTMPTGCPPDMMCATSGGEPIPYGDADCAHCSGPAPEGTCMDGQQGNETCDPDVYYIGGPEPTRGPADGSCENCRGNEDQTPVIESQGAPASSKEVPAPAIALGILGVAAAALLALPRRK